MEMSVSSHLARPSPWHVSYVTASGVYDGPAHGPGGNMASAIAGWESAVGRRVVRSYRKRNRTSATGYPTGGG